VKPPTSVFLARKGYRLRRAMDAARFLPIVGGFLFFLPLLWPGGYTGQGVIYLFSIWAILIVVSAALSRMLSYPSGNNADGSDEGSQ
jgi:hypothetical protein